MNSRVRSIVAGAVAGAVGVTEAAAQTNDIASAGNGGVASASANGGAVSMGNINSGGNVGNAIGIGNTYGYVDPTVYGGDVSNATTLGVAANGGTAIADASGGNYNLAFVS
jgi:hypothetical protein